MLLGINTSQIDEVVKPQLAQMASKTANIPKEFVDSFKQRLRQQAIEKMIIEDSLRYERELKYCENQRFG